jgi:hypothetical protein
MSRRREAVLIAIVDVLSFALEDIPDSTLPQKWSDDACEVHYCTSVNQSVRRGIYHEF